MIRTAKIVFSGKFRWWVPAWIALTLIIFSTFSNAAQPQSKPNLVTIPLSLVDVDQATATISVMEDSLSSFNTFLKDCQTSWPEDFIQEDQELSKDLRKFCEMTEKMAKRYFPPPTQNFEPKEYIITVPLKSPFQGIEALLWSTKSLDDAISFVSLLQGGNLKAVKVYTTIPWSLEPATTCTECPIKELVFSASGIKEQLQELKKKEGTTKH